MDALTMRDLEDLELGRIFRKLLCDTQPSTYISIQTEPGFPWLVMDLHIAPSQAEAELIAKVLDDHHSKEGAS